MELLQSIQAQIAAVRLPLYPVTPLKSPFAIPKSVRAGFPPARSAPGAGHSPLRRQRDRRILIGDMNSF